MGLSIKRESFKIEAINSYTKNMKELKNDVQLMELKDQNRDKGL